MGRHPHAGGPVFRFTQIEVVEMEACLLGLKNAIPAREMICALTEKFNASTDRAGKSVVQPKQVWNWFQNRRYSQRAKVKAPGNLNVLPVMQDDSTQFKNDFHSVSILQGQNSLDKTELEFEAKSARDGAWYDVSLFLSHRKIETDDPEVRVRFSGFGVEEDEWVNVLQCVRQRSLPCENVECIALLPGDLILCFQLVEVNMSVSHVHLNRRPIWSSLSYKRGKLVKQEEAGTSDSTLSGRFLGGVEDHLFQEGIEQALYFDAHIVDAQRRRHDVRGCRCRFLVRYDHDKSEEIVPLRKICRRPETEYRLQQIQALRVSGSADEWTSTQSGSSRGQNFIPRRMRKHSKLAEVNTAEITTIALPAVTRIKDHASLQIENATFGKPQETR